MLSRFSIITTRLLVVLLSVLFFSCSKKDDLVAEPQPAFGTTAGRTVIVYIAGENSLSPYVTADVQELLRGVGYMGKNDHLVVFVDNAAKARLYDITWRDTLKSIRDLTPVYQWKEDINSCDVKSLESVLNYARTSHPTSSYYLVMWSHGSGWLPTRSSQSNSGPLCAFGYDNMNGTTNDTGPQMDIKDFAIACEKFGELDMIMFDACFMQNIETLYQLRHSARYIIGSPAEIPADGAPYHLLLQPFFTDGDNISAILSAYHKGYSNNDVLLTAVKTSALESFMQVTASFVSKYKEDFFSVQASGLLNYYDYDSNSNRGNFPDFFDIRGLMQRVLSVEDYQTWKAEFEKLIAASVVSARWQSMFSYSGYCTVNKSQYGGVTMHVPLLKYDNKLPWISNYFYSLDWTKQVW